MATQVPAKRNRGPWILVGVLGCLALCLLMVLISGGTYLLVGRNQTTPVARNLETPTLPSKPPPPIAPSLTPFPLNSPPPIASSAASATQVPTLTPNASNGKIAFVSERDGGSAIYVMNADGSQQTRVSENSRMSASPSWSPDGKQILFTMYAPASPGSDFYLPSLFRMNADGSQPIRLGANVEAPNMVAWSPDGTRIALVAEMIAQLYLIPADGSNAILLSKSTRDVEGPAWSPDGKQIAFKAVVNGTSEICIINADGSQEKRLTNHASIKPNRNVRYDDLPVWSPDGKRIAFSSTGTNKSDLYVMNADGSQRINLTNKPASYALPAWSPDGEHIVFSSDRETGYFEIFTINSDGTDLKRLWKNLGVIRDEHPAWSPDGKRIVYDSNKPERRGDQDIFTNSEIYVINADGTGLTRLTDNLGVDKNPVWQPPNR